MIAVANISFRAQAGNSDDSRINGTAERAHVVDHIIHLEDIASCHGHLACSSSSVTSLAVGYAYDRIRQSTKLQNASNADRGTTYVVHTLHCKKFCFTL